MHPICFEIGGHAIYWYGVMMALAFVAGMLNWWRLGRRAGRTWEDASDLGFWIMIAGIVGARLAYVASDGAYFMAHPELIVRVDQGGLIYYGGFIGAIIAVLIIALRRREPPFALGDFVVTSLPLGHAIGRIGCFLNGCCYGTPTNLPWAVTLEGALRHPVQLYETALNLLVFIFLRQRYLRGAGRPGHVLAWYLLTYSPIRFLLEFWRGDDRLRWWGGMTVAQDISLVLFFTGVVLWSLTRNRHEHTALAS